MSGSVLPLPALVVLVGPSGAGKSVWADEHFVAGEVVSSDRLRAAVGRGPADLDASEAAFEVLERIVDHRLGRGLTVAVDTLGLDPAFRASMLSAARSHAMRAVVVMFDTPPELCRARNRSRPTPVPAAVLTSQIRRFREQRAVVESEGWDLAVTVAEVAGVSERPEDLTAAGTASVRRSSADRLEFGLVISSFPWSRCETAARLGEVARAAENAGFISLWVMDHLIQIPQVGRRWDPMLEGPTTLAWLAAITERMTLGPLVANASLRNPAHLAKIVATIDVLSQGRARLGLGAGWWKQELTAYGLGMGSAGERLDRLEDALRLLPLMWGPGTVDFVGRTVTVKGAECYPRPLQERIPLLVGGQGPRRTLQLVARHADAVNLRGDPAVVAAAVDVLTGHCRAAGRDLAEIEMSHLSWPVVAADRSEAAVLGERFRRGDAATLDEHTGRCETLADIGVTTFLLAPPDLIDGPMAVERLAPLVKRLA